MSVRAYYEERYNTGSELQISEGDSMVFPPHLHNDLELFLVRDGSYQITVGDTCREVGENTLAVIFPNTIHAYQCKVPGSGYIIAVCSPALLGDALSRLTRFRPACPFLQGQDLHRDILYAMQGLCEQSRTEPDREIYRALVRLILARCFSRMELLPLQEPHTVDLTGNLVRYLSCNFQKPLSLDTVARELGVSKYHLSHIFSSRLHTSFSEYVNFLRLNLARELLLTTDQSILELGLACGFSSQRTFNRVFQIHMGMSPRQYRELKSVASHNPLTIP